MSAPGIVFIQRRPNRGGAQVALARLVAAPEIAALKPLVIVGGEGWLPTRLRSTGTAVHVMPVPATRSIAARLFGNRRFVRHARSAIKGRPLAIVANNHQEAALAAGLAQALGTRSAVILRDSHLTKEALERYQWDLPDHAFAVGYPLTELARACNASVPVTPLFDAVESHDFAPPKAKPARFPDGVLVVGSDAPQKGWRDWIEAAARATDAEPALAQVRFDFTGSQPKNIQVDSRHRFIGHREGFHELVRTYDLVVNPSRIESFGLAAVETLAAGVPLLTTPVGVLGRELPHPEPFTIPAADPHGMAERLGALFRGWREADPRLEDSQSQIRARFSPAAAAAPVLDCIERMQRRP